MGNWLEGDSRPSALDEVRREDVLDFIEPSVAARDGSTAERTGALRFGDSRAMALAGALCITIHAVTGVRKRSLRALVAGLLGASYTAAQMTYDLRRLRLHGLIERIAGTHTYTLTPDGVRVALFYTKVHDRLLRPLLAADRPPAPPELRVALKTIDQAVAHQIADARITKAAA